MTTKHKRRTAGFAAVLMLGAFSLLFVSRDRTTAGEAASAPEVEVASVEQKDIPIYREWIGTAKQLWLAQRFSPLSSPFRSADGVDWCSRWCQRIAD
jgi:hypothetical protein